MFDDDDHRYDFQRPVELFNLLITKFKEAQPHYVEAFFAFAGTFLSHHYQITKGGRNHSITFYQYPLPFYEVTKDFRKAIWTTLVNSIEVGCYLQFESFEKFIAVDMDIILNILQIVVDKIEKQNLRINLSFHFFEKYSIMLAGNFSLLAITCETT